MYMIALFTTETSKHTYTQPYAHIRTHYIRTHTSTHPHTYTQPYADIRGKDWSFPS